MSKNNPQTRFDRANNPIADAIEAAFRPLIFNTKARNHAASALLELARNVVKEASRDRREAEAILKKQEEEREQRRIAYRRLADAQDAILAQREAWAKEYGYELKDGKFVQA